MITEIKSNSDLQLTGEDSLNSSLQMNSHERLNIGTMETICVSITNGCSINNVSFSRKETKKRVSFGKVSIREYNIIPGDNPSVGMGPPLSLGWKFVDLEDIDVEEHHHRYRRHNRKNVGHLVLNSYKRKKILFYDWGFNEEDIDLSTKLAHKVKMQRWRTQRLLRLQVFDGGMKSAKRLVKRTIMKRND